jgi:hypothetical protein
MTTNDEQRCNTRIGTRSGTYYVVQETIDEVRAQAEAGEWLDLISMTGQALMPPERLILRAEHIGSLQEISPEGWLWQKRSDELHYARQMQELDSNPTERLAAAQERIAAALSDAHEDGDE